VAVGTEEVLNAAAGEWVDDHHLRRRRMRFGRYWQTLA
jgi:hypothetical protein